MSHFPVLVLVNDQISRDEATDAVTPLLAPYDENDEWFADGSRWDWWQVGGRYAGSLALDYEPEDDPRNTERCDLCGGTGDRAMWREEPREGQHPSGCNGCLGKGERTKWPTQWAEFDGDVRSVRDVQFKTYRWEQNGEQREQPFVPAAVVTPDGKWHERARMGWFGVTTEDEQGQGAKDKTLWAATVQALLEQNPDATAVVVDCHV